MFETLAWIALLLAGSPAQDAPRAGASASPQTQAVQQEKQPDATTSATFRITGRVVNSMTNAPVPGAYVVMTSSSAPTLNRTVRAGTDGSFAFAPIPAGRYALRARRKGYVEQLYLQHEQYTTAIIVGPNLNSEDLVFPLAPEGVISGEVTDEVGEPVQSAKIVLFREDTEIGRHAKHFKAQQFTNEEGRYRFRSLPRGSYYLAVSAQPWYAQYARSTGFPFRDAPAAQKSGLPNSNLDLTYPITYYPNATDESGAASIHVEAGGSARADMKLVPVPALHIRLEVGDVDPQTYTQAIVTQAIFGAYRDQATVSARESMPESASEAEAEGGAGQPSRARVLDLDGLRPGPAVVEAKTGKAGEAWQASSVSKSVPVDPTDGQTVDARGIAPTGVSGIVKLDANVAAPPGVNVFLRGASKGTIYRASADSAGSFRFSAPIEPGVYAVSSGGPGGLRLRSVTANGAKVIGTKIEINNASEALLTLTLARGVNARVKGIVERGGKPAPAMMVVLVPEDARESTEYRRDQSDSDGSFSLNEVSPGKYTVVAITDWDLEWVKPEVIREYLAAGTPVQVAGGVDQDIKVTVK
jgi:protocatechuate 3,4-dioxygenase beta subunit